MWGNFSKMCLCVLAMSYRGDNARTRELIVSTHLKLSCQSNCVTPTKVWNHLKTHGHPRLGKSLVFRTLKRQRETGCTSDRPRVVKRRKITDSVKKSVIQYAKNTKKPKYMRSTRKVAQIKHGRGKKRVKISRESVRTVLKASGNKYRRTTRRPVLTKHHIRMRYLWACEHKDDSVGDWMRTLAIDETHFETFHKSNRQNSGSWVDDDDEIEYEMTVKHPGRVSASTGVCGHGAAIPDLYTDRFNQHKFTDVHLKNHYHPAMVKNNCRRLLMDNDRSHHSKKALKWMNENGVNYSAPPPPPCHLQRCRCEPPEGFWFPAYAPEVSPAELYNNYIQQELDKATQRLGHPGSIEILKSRVKRIVRGTPKSYFKKLMEGMPKRVKKLYDARGMHFK